jgi:hypothetical protein
VSGVGECEGSACRSIVLGAGMYEVAYLFGSRKPGDEVVGVDCGLSSG